MGKRQHQKDKMYLTTTEWSSFYGGYKKSSHAGSKANFRRLPLTYCTLSLKPFVHPYCDQKGNIFDLEVLLPFLKKFKVNPVTGEPLTEKSLIKLTFHKSSGGDYHCPVLYKTLSNNTHVVAIKTSGNVFSYEAIEQLNLKCDNWREPLTDEPFTRSDIIHLQDPQDLDKFNVASFHHINKKLKVENDELVKASSNSSFRLKNITQDTQEILKEIKDTCKEPEKKTKPIQKVADKINAAHYSLGDVAASFTSTTQDVSTTQKAAILDDEVVIYKRVKKKGYVSLITNLGALNLELYCNTVPKACDNFIQLCEKNYYNGTLFHRSIKHFMIQGGDPTGTGNGGESCWGGKFEDTFKPNLSHKGRGVLSMANSGPNTNKSQFFITFRSCTHLDGKHTIFGRVVGGLPTLSAMESVGTDNKDRPVEDIRITTATVFVNPFKEVIQQIEEERQKEEDEKQALEDELKSRKRPKVDNSNTVYRSGVGKFLNLAKVSVPKESLMPPPRKKAATSAYKLSNFDMFD